MGSARTLVNEVVFVIGRASTDITTTATTQNASTFDRLNTANALHDLVAVVDVGTWTTDGTVTVHLEESANDSDWTDVVAAEVVLGQSVLAAAPSGSVASDWIIDSADDDNVAAVFGYLGDSRYVRVSFDVSGQTTGSLAATQVFYIATNPRNMIDRAANASA